MKKYQDGYYSLNEKSQFNNKVTSFDHNNKQPLEDFLKLDISKIEGLLENELLSLSIKLKLTKNIIHYCIFRNHNIEKIEYI